MYGVDAFPIQRLIPEPVRVDRFKTDSFEFYKLDFMHLLKLDFKCDIAMNLDVPPGGEVFTDYDECLKMSADNFEYFAKNRIKGKVDFINILQAGFDHRTLDWYNAVKDFQFEGWSIGGVQGQKLSSMLYAVAILSNNTNSSEKYSAWTCKDSILP